ncbi:hypothetical protein SAMN05444372_112177 [Flavobacterium micromati]|uniref:Uncharacterized protein n=1 Tax=Flavobacterium micromati TaxID=229205 RepID=A0A1M5PEU2_9FLAO|nr:hypothetical protein [Flavobacterium micromati]SHH00265.1 hypothetical protein SAMN05444372_112177 [Flavobacterium micromati]
MAKLSDFLGGLASSICAARVNSDVQSLRIAEEYAKNELLKHFSVPRMRIDRVELNIPVAVDNLVEKTQKIYQPINKSLFLKKTNQQIITSIPLSRLSIEDADNLKKALIKNLKPAIENSIKTMDASIIVNQNDEALKEYSENIASKTLDFINNFYRKNNIKFADKEISILKDKISAGLQAKLREELIFKQQIKSIDSIDVIVESEKLRDIKSENVLMIKMIISEQGMEWVTLEDINGNVINKLMPE